MRERCRQLLSSLELPFAPVTDDYVDHPDPRALERRRYDEHRIEVPVVETPAGWLMRVSVQAYNDESDLASLTRAAGS